jgi:hypothetical protein
MRVVPIHCSYLASPTCQGQIIGGEIVALARSRQVVLKQLARNALQTVAAGEGCRLQNNFEIFVVWMNIYANI